MIPILMKGMLMGLGSAQAVQLFLFPSAFVVYISGCNTGANW